MTRQPVRLADRLCGGDRRSTGAADRVAREAEDDPALLADLIGLMRHPEPLVAMRAADATEKATRTSPATLAAHRDEILYLAEEATQQEVRWHLAQMLPRLELSAAQLQQVAGLLETYLTDPSQIVRVNTLQALADLASSHPALRRRVDDLLAQYLEDGGKAVRARCRRLLTSQRGQ